MKIGHVLLASLKIGWLFSDIFIILTCVLIKYAVRTDGWKAGVEKKIIIFLVKVYTCNYLCMPQITKGHKIMV